MAASLAWQGGGRASGNTHCCLSLVCFSLCKLKRLFRQPRQQRLKAAVSAHPEACVYLFPLPPAPFWVYLRRPRGPCMQPRGGAVLFSAPLHPHLPARC